jgi:hypothetical protein
MRVIRIKADTEAGKFQKFSLKFPAELDFRDWCGRSIPDSKSKIECSRTKGHTGPHRRYEQQALHLWYDEGHDREERLLTIFVRLDLDPTDYNFEMTSSPSI